MSDEYTVKSSAFRLTQTPQRFSLDPSTAVHWVNENTCLLEIDIDVESTTHQITANSDRQNEQLIRANAHVAKWTNTLLFLNSPTRANTNDNDHSGPPWLLQYVPAYTSLLIVHDLSLIDQFAVLAYLKQCAVAMQNESSHHKDSLCSSLRPPQCHNIEVCYALELELVLRKQGVSDFERPNDLATVSKNTGMKADEIIRLHSAKEYRVFTVGFLPNFAYLGLTDSRLALPRLKHPRKKVPAGAVAIADNQTAIYPQSSPGGWHILGYSYLDLRGEQTVGFRAGDTVRFSAISEEEYCNKLHAQRLRASMQKC